MPNYKKKSSVIQAFKWTGDIDQKEDPEWIVEAIKNGQASFIDTLASNVKMCIVTHEHAICANRGDYIIKNTNGEISICDSDTFEKIYEKSETDNKQSYIISMNDGTNTIANTDQSIKEIRNHIASDSAVIIGGNIFRSSLINSVVKCKKQ